ncbi:MAG TPA: pilus assembly protein TadG-related protein [Terrimesophilobacter sp.]|nr:pilus assembly protein TadG-related protein [Terrimesophilobacter sp.]
MRRLTALRDDDTGSTLVLTIFYSFLALVLIFVVVAATSLYLERKRLFTLADGAALVGAEAFELADVTVEDGVPSVILESEDVAADVAAYLARVPNHGFEALAVEGAHTVDGRSATVTLSAYWRPPLVTLLVPDGIRIEVTALARSIFG